MYKCTSVINLENSKQWFLVHIKGTKVRMYCNSVHTATSYAQPSHLTVTERGFAAKEKKSMIGKIET